jgi:hypothetical protein
MVAAAGIDELGGDPNAVSGLAHASLHHVARTELPAHRLHVHRPALVDEARVPRDHRELAEGRQPREQVLGEPVGEVLLLRIPAQVVEGQHRDGMPPRETGNAELGRLRGGMLLLGAAGIRRRNLDAEHVHRPRDVLESSFSQIPELHGQLAFDVLVDRPGDRDATGIRERFEPCSDVHPVPGDPIAFHDDVAEIDADAEGHATLRREPGVAGFQLALDVHAAGDGVHDACELRQQVVAHRVHDAPSVLAD